MTRNKQATLISVAFDQNGPVSRVAKPLLSGAKKELGLPKSSIPGSYRGRRILCMRWCFGLWHFSRIPPILSRILS